MPPKPYKALKTLEVNPTGHVTQVTQVTQAGPKPSPGGNIVKVSLDKRSGHSRPVPDMSSLSGLSIDKHVDKQRYKIAYSLDKLTDDLARAASSPRKKDKEYIKGIVWSIGVLFDKLANGAQQDAIVVRIPARLLENVKAVIAIQASKKAAPVVVNPAPQTTALDTESSGSVVNTTGYVVPVAEVVAHDLKTLDPAPSALA